MAKSSTQTNGMHGSKAWNTIPVTLMVSPWKTLEVSTMDTLLKVAGNDPTIPIVSMGDVFDFHINKKTRFAPFLEEHFERQTQATTRVPMPNKMVMAMLEKFIRNLAQNKHVEHIFLFGAPQHPKQTRLFRNKLRHHQLIHLKNPALQLPGFEPEIQSACDLYHTLAGRIMSLETLDTLKVIAEVSKFSRLPALVTERWRRTAEGVLAERDMESRPVFGAVPFMKPDNVTASTGPLTQAPSYTVVPTPTKTDHLRAVALKRAWMQAQ